MGILKIEGEKDQDPKFVSLPGRGWSCLVCVSKQFTRVLTSLPTVKAWEGSHLIPRRVAHSEVPQHSQVHHRLDGSYINDVWSLTALCECQVSSRRLKLFHGGNHYSSCTLVEISTSTWLTGAQWLVVRYNENCIPIIIWHHLAFLCKSYVCCWTK